VFAHGFGGGIADTRPLGSGVSGTKVFFSFRGHGGSAPLPAGWGYSELADDLGAVAEAEHATRAVGVSLGAGALTRLVAGAPSRFDRLVLFLPAVLDQPRPATAQGRFAAMAAALAADDADALAGVVRLEVPEAEQGSAAARVYVERRVATLRAPGVAGQLERLPGLTAVDSLEALRAVTAPALVIGCLGDPMHPTDVAERLAATLPNASLHIYPEPGVLWTERRDLRARLGGFLNA
jgi:pimeloyl-ACP methyl ester carboxylesterase